jgi:hypothetical protein
MLKISDGPWCRECRVSWTYPDAYAEWNDGAGREAV